MRSHLRPALVLFLLLTLLTGVFYPLTVTAVAQAIFPAQANGSFITVDGQTLGSELIAQPFDAPRYFWSRPSAAGYDASASSGSNLGTNNPALLEAVQARIAALQAAGPAVVEPVETQHPTPADLVTSSASGLDPHISVEAALYQVSRVAQARGLDEATVKALVAQSTEGRQFGFLGQPRVNVLKLNLALDRLQ
jgi:K+-transporting ATPase ATPase C chain